MGEFRKIFFLYGTIFWVGYVLLKAGALKVLDEANARAEGLTMFYGIPFRFIRD